MGKYLVLWEMDSSRAPADRKERGVAWSPLVGMVKQDLKEGRVKDWGAYSGEPKGYAIFEGTHVELGKYVQQYYPYSTFEIHEVGSIDIVGEVLKSLTS